MTLDVEQETQTVTETATATATVTGDDGEPFEGAMVDFTTEHSQDGTVVPSEGSDDTDARGEATFEFTTAEPGTVTVTGTTDGLEADAEVTFVDQFRIEEATAEGETATVSAAYTQPLRDEADRAEEINSEQFFLLEGADADDLDPADSTTFAQQGETVTVTDAEAGQLDVQFADDLDFDTQYTLAYVEDTDADVRVKNPEGDDALSPDSATFAT